MGEVTLRLQVDRQTGKKNVIITDRSDESALPMEHEEEHRALVDKLIQDGTLKASQLGKVIVQRGEGAPTAEAGQTAEPEQERVGVKQ